MRHYKVKKIVLTFFKFNWVTGSPPKISHTVGSMVPDIHAKFQNQQFIMRRAIKLFLTLFVQNDLKWRTFSITLAKLEPQWPHSEQRSDVIHGSVCGNHH